MLNSATMLALLSLLPFTGAVLCLCVYRQRAVAIYLAETVMLLALALGTLVAWEHSRTVQDGSGASDALEPRITAIDLKLGRLAEKGPTISVHIAADGLNIWLVFLTLAVGTAVVASSASWAGENAGVAMACLLAAIGFTLLAFLSMDMLVFYVFFELTLVPVFLLVGLWGGPDRQVAAQRMFLHTLAGGLCTLLGLLTIGSVAGDFSWTALKQSSFKADGLLNSSVVFLLLMAGFVVKTPLVPLHTWQAITYRQAPTPVTAFLSAVMAKLGLYGMLRLGVFVLPAEMESVGAPVLGTMAVLSIVVGALCAFGARDIKTLLAYSSLSHLGYVVLGIVSLDPAGEQGALFHMVAHGVVTTGLLLAAGYIESSEGTLERSRLKGLLGRYPWISGLFVFFSLASVGVPGLSQFVGEFLCLLGFFRSGVSSWLGPIAIAGVMSGLFLGAWYTMTLIQQSFSGESPEGAAVDGPTTRQLVVLGSMAALVLWLGIAPSLVLQTSRPEIKMLERRLQSATGVVEPRLVVAAGLARPRPE
jgi:NADH-quinone oxidoreductase subunit M